MADAALAVIRCRLWCLQRSLVILRLFSSLVTGQEEEAICVKLLSTRHSRAQPVVTGDDRAGREHQPVGLGISDLLAAVRPDERRI